MVTVTLSRWLANLKLSSLIWFCATVAVISLTGIAGADDSNHSGGKPPAVEPWTAQAICAALEWREGKLGTCSFKTFEKRFYTVAGVDGEQPLADDDLDVKCKNGVIWIDLCERAYGKDSINIDHALQTWDGAECKWLNRAEPGHPDSDRKGGINGVVPPLFSTTIGLDVLGFKEAGNNYPWSVWISKMLQVKGTTATVGSSHERGHDLVTLVISRSDAQKVYSFEFLSDKDFVCDDYTLRFVDNPLQWHQRLHVDDIKLFDGLWAPSKATDTVGDKTSGNVVKFELKSLSFSPPIGDEMKIDFPIGTRVMDTLHLQYYTVKPNGEREYHSYYDDATGKVIQPPSERTPK